DCRAAALISSDASIDWLCLPRFNSPSVFGALLDDQIGGRFRIRPVGPYSATRAYVPDTNVLETTFKTGSGLVVVRDAMPVRSEPEKDLELIPDHEVLREIEVLSGEVDVEVTYEPRPDYGLVMPHLVKRGGLGVWWEGAGVALALLTDF